MCNFQLRFKAHKNNPYIADDSVVAWVSVQCTVYSVQCTVYSVQCTVYSVQCTVYSVQCTVYSVQCTVYSVQCTVYSVQCTLFSLLYASSSETKLSKNGKGQSLQM